MGTATGPAAPQEVKIHTGCGPAALQKSHTTDCGGGCQVVLWAAVTLWLWAVAGRPQAVHFMAPGQKIQGL